MINNSRIKILMITARADYGGGPEHLFQLIRRLKSQIEFYIACPDDQPYFELYAAEIGKERIVFIPHRKFQISAFLRLKRFAEENHIDIIHSHGKGAGIYSRPLAFLTGIKCVHTFHGLHVGENKNTRDKIYLSIEKILSRFTEIFIAVSTSEKEKIKSNLNIFDNKVLVINNGVEVRNVVREKPAGKSMFDILHISRFDDAKNTSLLLRIASDLKARERIINFKIHIIGDGRARTEFESKLKEKDLTEYFVFYGFRHDLEKFWGNSDVYISTSKMEGLPLSVLQAMASGLPAVATRVTGNVDIIEHGLNGFLYDLEAPVEAAKYLELLYSDVELCREMSRQAVKTVAMKFGVERMDRKTLDLYHRITAEI